MCKLATVNYCGAERLPMLLPPLLLLLPGLHRDDGIAMRDSRAVHHLQ